MELNCGPAGPQGPGGGGGGDEFFPCPFCYTGVLVPFLCNHLQQEHCFDTSRNAVCPICAESLGSDAASHFRIQHSHLLKKNGGQRRKLSPARDREADGEEGSYSEEASSSCFNGTDICRQAPDPLLSHFLCIFAPIELAPDEAEDQSSSRPDERDASDLQQDIEERLQRVEFVRQMLMTTMA